MATTEARLAQLEGQVQAHSEGFPALRDSIGRLEQRLDTRIGSLEQRLDARIESLELRVDTRFEAVDRRFDHLDSQFGTLMTMLVSLLVAVIAGFAATFLTR